MHEQRPRLKILWTQTATNETMLQDETTAHVCIVSALQSQRTHGQPWLFKMRIESAGSLPMGAFIHAKCEERYHAQKNLRECTLYLLCESNGCKNRASMATQLCYLLAHDHVPFEQDVNKITQARRYSSKLQSLAFTPRAAHNTRSITSVHCDSQVATKQSICLWAAPEFRSDLAPY